VDVLGGFDFDHRQASIPPRGQQIENASFTRGELRSLSINGPPKKRGVDPFHIRAYLRFQPRLGMARIQRILAIRGPCVTHPRQTSANASISPIRLWVAKCFRSRPNIGFLPPRANSNPRTARLMEPSGWSRRCTPSIAASLSTHSISSTRLSARGCRQGSTIVSKLV